MTENGHLGVQSPGKGRMIRGMRAIVSTQVARRVLVTIWPRSGLDTSALRTHGFEK
jgi:hypothetical protein